MDPVLEPLLQAALVITKDCHERMRRVVQKADTEALNWRPGPDTNSIYVLVNHALNAQKTWLANAVGEQFADRPARAVEFSLSGEPATLLRRLDEAAEDVKIYLEKLKTEDLTRELRRFGDQPVSGAWAFLHALEHPQEHLAHIELTWQLWEQRQNSAS